MKLSALVGNLKYQLLQGTMEKDVSELIYFSDEAVPGSVFFAIPGTLKNGTCYIGEAIKRGAETIVVEEGQDLQCLASKGQKERRIFTSSAEGENVTVLQVKDVRKALAWMSRSFFGKPDQDLMIIGITGTKGKTSTAYMLRQILEAGGIPTGLISTAEIGYTGHFCQAEHTTPQSKDIYQWCRRMVDGGCKALVMEVSSQGLMQSRVEGISFAIGIFTNISPDHIGEGEHKSFEEYFYWKSTLFKHCKKAIINGDDPHGKEILKNIAPEDVFTFGTGEEADFRIQNCRLSGKGDIPGICFCMNGRDVYLPMAGRFNAWNGAAAAAAANVSGVGWAAVKKGLCQVKVPGRVEVVDGGRPCTILVDYAHNGEALRKVLTGLREYKPKRLILVFGCGGNRDRNRRFEMGRVAAQLADFTVITSDNPRREEPKRIIRDIEEAMNEAGGTSVSIEDRAKAIKYAIECGEKGDMILIAGKGHETYQMIGTEKRYFDDREVITSMRKNQ